MSPDTFTPWCSSFVPAKVGGLSPRAVFFAHNPGGLCKPSLGMAPHGRVDPNETYCQPCNVEKKRMSWQDPDAPLPTWDVYSVFVSLVIILLLLVALVAGFYYDLATFYMKASLLGFEAGQ